MIVSKRTKTCRHCGAEFLPFQSTQKVCSVACAAALGREKTIADNAKAERNDIAARKLALKLRSDWLKEAQQAFNEFIRTRDAGQPCISCGRLHTGKVNAGHYLSVGARPDLRFTEDNVHLQCEPCNTNLSGNIAKYRPNLIAKIGADRLAEIEGPAVVCKWSIEEIKQIKATYKAATKALLAERELNGQAA